MSTSQHRYASLGMILGTAIGGALGILLLVFTGQAIYIVVAGLGTALGLSLGAGIDRSIASQRKARIRHGA
jgi:hypothetical protein